MTDQSAATPPRSVPAAWPTAQAALLMVTEDDDTGLEPMVVALREDDVDVDGSPTPLRVYDRALRDEVADAMRRFVRHDAPGWIGPEVVLGAVERHLLTNLLPRPTMEDRMTDQATTTQATETTHDVTSSPVPRRTVGPLEVVVTNLVPANTADVKWAMEQLTEHASEVDAVRVASDVWEALHAVLDGETAGDAATAGPRVTVDNLLSPGTWAADVAPLVAANTVTETGPATDPEATTV